jgi:hypothetical protein
VQIFNKFTGYLISFLTFLHEKLGSVSQVAPILMLPTPGNRQQARVQGDLPGESVLKQSPEKDQDQRSAGCFHKEPSQVSPGP